MANTKPFVAAAFLCEKVLQEPDNVQSAIRIVDTFFVPANLPNDATPVVLITGIVSLKSGGMTGSHHVKLVLENTKAIRSPIGPEAGWPVVFSEDPADGFTVTFTLPLGVKHFGLIWIDVIFDDEVLTRIPIKLRAQEAKPNTEVPS